MPPHEHALKPPPPDADTPSNTDTPNQSGLSTPSSSGGATGAGLASRISGADPGELHWRPFDWDVKLMLAALESMETTLDRARTDPLLPETPLPPPPEPELAESLTDWDFDLFEVPYDELPELAYNALVMHPAISAPSSNLDLAKLWRFVREVAARYHERPFHNFRHGTDVLLATSALVRTVARDNAAPFADGLMVAALLVSALVHDTDHPAVSGGLAAWPPRGRHVAAPCHRSTSPLQRSRVTGSPPHPPCSQPRHRRR